MNLERKMMNLIKYWLISESSPIKKYIIENSGIIGTIIAYLFILAIGYVLYKNRKEFQKHYIDFMVKWQMKINQLKNKYK